MPYQPTFDTLDIFGAAVSIKDRPAPPEIQVTAFGGLNGVDLLVLGSRGSILEVAGLLWSDTYRGLMAVLATWRAYRDASAAPGFAGYTVVDNFDQTWTNCLVRSFAPADKVLFDTAGTPFSGDFEFSLPYHMEILAPRKPIPPPS